MFGKKVASKEVEETRKALIKVTKDLEEKKKEIKQKTNDLVSCNLKFKQIETELRKLKGEKSAKRRTLWDKVDTDLDIEYHRSVLHDVDDIIDALYEVEKVFNEATSAWIVKKIVTSTKVTSHGDMGGRVGKVTSEQVILAGKLLAKKVQKRGVKVQLN